MTRIAFTARSLGDSKPPAIHWETQRIGLSVGYCDPSWGANDNRRDFGAGTQDGYGVGRYASRLL